MVAVAALASLGAMAMPAVAATPAATVKAPTAAATFTPASVAPGGVSRLVVSATNNTTRGMSSVALGVVLPPLPVTIVRQPAGAGCRRAVGNLLYCLVSLSPGTTRSLILDVTGSAVGTFTASSYARNIATMDETGATATLTVG